MSILAAASLCWFLLIRTAKAGCDFPLGLQNYDIEDYQLSASGTKIQFYKEFYPPWNARLNSPFFSGADIFGREYAWYQSDNVPGDWLQLDLLVPHLVTGIGYQGNPSGHYMRTFYLAHSYDMLMWSDYGDESGNRQLLPEGRELAWSTSDPEGTFDKVTWSPLQAQGLRVYPESVHFSASIRLEIFGCALDISNYDEITTDDSDITQMTSSGNSQIEMTMIYRHTVTAITVEGSLLDPGRFEINTSVSVQYKKMSAESNWRPINLNQESVSAESITLTLAHAVSVTDVIVNCDVSIITCSRVLRFYGKKLGPCPPGFIDEQGQCYKHIRFHQSMSSVEERSICPRMSWSEEVYTAYPRSIEELYLLQNFKEVSGRTHIGLFREDDTSQWVTQSSQSDAQFYWQENVGHGLCASVENYMDDVLCTDRLPVTCVTTAQGQDNPDLDCGWLFHNTLKIRDQDTEVHTGLDLSECLAKCQEGSSAAFTCRSVEWYSSRTCHLSEIHTESYGVSLDYDGSVILAEYTCVSESNCLTPLLFPTFNKSDLVTFTSSSTHTLSDMDNIKLVASSYPQLSGGYWFPASYSESWFQVDFADLVVIQKLVLGGGQSQTNCFIRTFHLSYSNSTEYWSVYKDSRTNINKLLLGPTGRYGLTKHLFNPAISATSVRVNPMTYHDRPCMAMELYGCTRYEDVKSSYWPYHSLGMGSHDTHDIDDNQITSSGFTGFGGVEYPPWQARLGNDPSDILFLEAFFWAGTHNVGDWIQIDLLTVHYVAGLAMGAGGSAYHYFMKIYSIRYSQTSPYDDLLQPVLDIHGNEQNFGGFFLEKHNIYTDLSNYTIYARYLRIVVQEMYANVHLRLEIYGRPSMSACPTVPTTALLTLSTPPPAGCSCSRFTSTEDTFLHCITDTPTTTTLEFTTMYLVQGIEMEFEIQALLEQILSQVEVAYYNPGNASWSTWWYDWSTANGTDPNSSVAVLQGHRVSKVLKLEINIPAVLSSESSCVRFTIRGCQAPACPPGYVQYRRECLHQPHLLIAMWDVTTKDWYWDLINRCQGMSWNGTAQMGSTIHLEQHMFVYNMNHRTGITMYNGYWAPDLTIHQPFVWEPVNNKTDGWIYWRPGQPDEVTTGHVPDRCSIIWPHEPRVDDTYCSEVKPFICKVDALHIAEKTDEVVYEWASRRNFKFHSDDTDYLNVGGTLSHCLSMCEADSQCNSVVHQYYNKQCYLSSTTLTNATTTYDAYHDYYYVQRFQEDCMSALVWTNYPLQVEVTGSSRKGVEYDVVFAELNNMVSLWWPYNDNLRASQFIQVDFHAVARVEKFVMLGGGDKKDCFVRTYSLLYTNDTRWWQVYTDQYGQYKIFQGNYHRYDTHTAYLIPPMIGRFVRIEAIAVHYSICLSFEMYGGFVAREDRGYCSVVLRGSGYNDHNYFGSAELNGHPYVFMTTEPTHSEKRGVFLLPLDHEFCFPSMVERFDIYGNSVYENNRMREFILDLENGTTLIGVVIDHATSLDTASTALFEELGLGVAASAIKQVYSSAFITTIGQPSLSQVEVAPNGRGPAMLQRVLTNRKTPGTRPTDTELPQPLVHWPMNLQHQHRDISGNNYHLQENNGEVPIVEDDSSYMREYALFDGAGFLRARVDKALTLDGDFTIFVALYPEKVGPIFEYHDSIEPNYQYYLHYMVYDDLYQIYLQSTTLDYYVSLDGQINHMAWNFITITYHLATKRISFWKNYRRIHSRIMPAAFKPGDTARDYLSVGYLSPFFRSSSVIHFKGKMACLQIYNATLSAGQIYRVMFECQGRQELHQDLSESVSDVLEEGPLGMMSGFIVESQTKVSSTSPHATRYYKDSLRLYTNGADIANTHLGCWMPLGDLSHFVHEWVEVDLGILHTVSGLAVGGCSPIQHFTSDMVIEYAGSDKNWTLMEGSAPGINMTAQANFDHIHIIKVALPERVTARYVRMWLHTTYKSALKLEVLGIPLELPPLTVDEIERVGITASIDTPKLIIQHQHSSDNLTECLAVTKTASEGWFELDLRSMYTITSILLMFQSDSTLSTDTGIYKRYYNTDWDSWPEVPLLRQTFNGSVTTFKYLLIPAINTRFLKLVLGAFNASCVWMTITGQKAPGCPPGSVYHENKCLYNHYKPSATEEVTSSTALYGCSKFTWATQGIPVQPKTASLLHHLGSISTVLNVGIYKTGLTHSGSPETAFWLDRTSANDIPWNTGAPFSGVYGVVDNLYFTGSSTEDTTRRTFFCEARSSGWDTDSEALRLIITADSSLKLFIDGRYKGVRTSWNNPWILDIPSNTQLLAVEATCDTLTPGLLAHLNNGVTTDSTWLCTTHWYKDWTEVDFDDSLWTNAAQIEAYGSSLARITVYGFTDASPTPYWIWNENYLGTIDEHIYCRKTLNVLMSPVLSNSSCTERWSAWPGWCLLTSTDPQTLDILVNADTVVDCLSQCQEVDGCQSVEYYTDRQPSCVLRDIERADTPRSGYSRDTQCYQFERWCADCSDYIIQNEYPKGLVNMSASDEKTPATDGILNTYGSQQGLYHFWTSGLTNGYQWIEARFADYIQVTGITVATAFTNGMEVFYVFYVDARTNLYRDIRDSSGNFREFVGVSEPSAGHAVNRLAEPIITQVVRVNPQDWTTQIALAFDVLGCVLKDFNPFTDKARFEYWTLGLESGEVGLSQLTATSTQHSMYSANQARFNRPESLPHSKGCWRPNIDHQPYILTIDLLIPHTIQGVQFQSCPGVSHYIERFSLRYSLDGENWVQTFDNSTGQEKNYTGSYFDGDFVGYLSLSGELPVARLIQYVIVDYVGDYPGLRLEIIGKPQDCPGIYTAVTASQGTDGIVDHKANKVVPTSHITLPTYSWCPDLDSLTPSEYPWATIDLESLYYVTRIEFVNVTEVNTVNVMFSTDSMEWRQYWDEQIHSKSISVSQGSSFSFQRLQKSKAVKLTLESWMSGKQPCIQVLVHACKAQACPPNSVQSADICYYTDGITEGDYDHVTDTCRQFDWAGPGYPIMPKDWLQFDFVQALAYPDRRYLDLYYLGLDSTDNSLYTWRDNSTVSDSTSLPWSTSPTHPCTQLGLQTDHLTAVTCDTVLKLLCQVQASVSRDDNQLMWTHRWNVFVGSTESPPSVTDVSLFECVLLCQGNSTCQSVVYSAEDRKCVVLEVTAETLDVETRENVSWHYYQKYDKELCEINLMEDVDATSSIQTSSSVDSSHSAEHVVYQTQFTVDQFTYWQASGSDLDRPWVNVDFGGYAVIKRIITSGAVIEAYWATRMSLLSSHNGEWFQYYSNNPERPLERLLTHPHGLSETLNAHTALLHPFLTRSLQITLESYVGQPVLRLAVFGCRVDADYQPECFHPLGLSNDGQVLPSQLTASSALADPSGDRWGPYNAGLDAIDQGENLAGWIPDPNTDIINSYIQVEFPVPYRVKYIVTQGVGSNHITSYDLHYRSENYTWSDRREDGSVLQYPGSLDKIIQPISPVLVTDAVRLYPRSYQNQIALRLEIVGCFQDCPVIYDLTSAEESQTILTPCKSNTSHNCITVCRHAESQQTVELTFTGVYDVTGFTVYSLNDTVDSALNITDGLIYYRTLVSGIDMEEPIQGDVILDSDDKLQWKWTLVHAQQMVGLRFNISFNHETLDCVELEIHGCKTTGCPVGFLQHKDQCYYYQDDPYSAEFVGRSLTDSQDICQSMSFGDTGHVVLPNSMEDDVFIQSLSSGTSFYLGAYCNIDQQDWLSMADNSSLSYTNWDVMSGEPDLSQGHQCVHNLEGYWVTGSCTRGKTLCQTKARDFSYFEWITIPNVNIQNTTANKVINETNSVSFCMQACSRTDGCDSVEYKAGIGQCLIYEGTRYTLPMNLTLGNNVYYEKLYPEPCVRALLDTLVHTVTASSETPSHTAQMAAVNNGQVPGSYWQPMTSDTNQWLQVEFTQEVTVHRLLVLGAVTSTARVTEFRLQGSQDAIMWYNITNQLTYTQVFNTYQNHFGLSQFLFHETVSGILFKIMPLAWSDTIAMQVKLFGCLSSGGLSDCSVSSNPILYVPSLSSSKSLECFHTWDIMVQHHTGRHDFNRTWDVFKHGFQSSDTLEYYVGNEVLQHLVSRVSYAMRIDMWVNGSSFLYAEYNAFSIRTEVENYRIYIDDFIGGTGGNGSLGLHNSMDFLTYDRETSQDINCSSTLGSGWWYLNSVNELPWCFHSVLTSPDIQWSLNSLGAIQNVQKVIVRIKADMAKVNVALQKEVHMSSRVSYQTDASYAVDGYLDNDPVISLCASTNTELKPYWLVTLDTSFYIASVSIVLMQGTPLEALAVKVGQLDTDTSNPNFTSYGLCSEVTPTTESITVDCVIIVYGGVVAILPQEDSITFLHLCEVAVYTTSVRVGLQEACTWDADCLVLFAQCVPWSVQDFTLNLTCQCQEGYLPESGLCKPNVDLTVAVAIDDQTNVLVRGLTMPVELSLTLENLDPRDVWSGSDDTQVNFDLNISIKDGHNLLSSVYVVEDVPFVYIEGSGYDGINGTDSVTQIVTAQVFFTPSQCSDVSYLCVQLTSTPNASYFERDDSNNVFCLNVENITVCKPDTDVELTTVVYNDSSLITRNISGPYSFTVTLNKISGPYPIVVLDGSDVNYNMYYFPSDMAHTDGSVILGDGSLQVLPFHLTYAQSPLDNTALSVTVMASIAMDYDICTQTNFVCFFVADDSSATYTEYDYENNINCLDITTYKICTPALELDVLDIFIPHDAYFIRGYNMTTTMDITFTNNHSLIPVDSVEDPWFNYNIDVLLTEDIYDVTGQTGLSSAVDAAFSLSELQQALGPKMTLTLAGNARILVPRSLCQELTYICAIISPGPGATFMSAVGLSHVKCVNSTDLINCQGLPVRNVTFNTSLNIQKVHNMVTFNITWNEGTDVNFTLSFGDSSDDIQWNWQTAGHTKHFGFKDFSTTHMYTEIGNYTSTLRIWNDLGEQMLEQTLSIEPDLEEYINVTVNYVPNAVPVRVVYQFHHHGFPHIAVPISMVCRFNYGDNSSDMKSIWVKDVYNMTYTFTKDVPDVSSSIVCENHVSVLNYNTTIILRQAVSELQILPHNEAFATGTSAAFNVSMETATHVLLAIDFGDGVTTNFTKESIYSYNFTWAVTHVYLQHGNYTVFVRGLNEHFSDTILINTTIQNPVLPFNITAAASNIKVPDGFVTFTLIVPQGSSVLLPDNVFCTWQFDHMTHEISYSTALVEGLPEIKGFTYERNQVGASFSVNVTCANLVSSESSSLEVHIFEELRNFDVTASKLSNEVKQNVTFEVTLSNGSHVEYRVDYNDGNVDIFHDPSLFSPGRTFVHSYDDVGNYSVNITAQNRVSSLSNLQPIDIVIQNAITNLTLFVANDSVLWPPGMIDFTIASGTKQPLLTDVHCMWTSGNYFNYYSYIGEMNTLDNVDYSHSFPRVSIGMANVTVNCSNLISWTELNASVLVILDEVILESVVTEWVWWTNTSSFNLTVQRFGTHSCFLWDMGDNTRYFYGRPWCASNASTLGLEVTLVEHRITNLYVNHTYDTWDKYTVSVFAFNHVSEDTVATVAIVKDWYCYTPNITFNESFTDPDNKITFMKSTQFSVAPTNIEIDCMKSLNRSESIVDVYDINDPRNPVVHLTSVTSFNHSVRQLPYGQYMVSVTVMMLGVSSVYKTEEAYFEVVKTPLDVSIKGTCLAIITGGYNRSINFNRELVLDSITVSLDHDVDPLADQELEFDWSCRQREEDFPMDQSGQIVPAGSPDPEQTSFELFSGCFGGGPGRLGDTSGILTIHTGDMMPDKDYVFRVTATKDTRVGVFEQPIRIIPPEAPNITVVCSTNCAAKRAVSKDLIIQAVCSEHCETKFGGAQFRWSLSRREELTGDLVEYENLAELTVSGTYKDSLHISPWTLVGGSVHTLVVESWTPGSYHSWTTYDFLTNLPPFGGSCQVDPFQGIVAETLFIFMCIGWEEWQAHDKNSLKYEYRVRSYGEKRSYLVFFGNDETSSPSMLPMGNYEVDFLNEMELYIVDSVGDYYLELVNVTVLPAPVSKAEVATNILSEISSPLSNFSQSLETSNYQALNSAVYSMTSVLNLPIDFDLGENITDDLSEVLALRKTARSSLIHAMTSVPVSSLDGLEQTNEVFRVILLREQEVTLNSQEQSLGKVSNMTSFFVESREGVTKEMKSQLATDLISSTLRLVTAADFVLKDSGVQSDNVSIYQTTLPSVTTESPQVTAQTEDRVGDVMKKSVRVIDTLTHTLLSDKALGDPEDVVALEYVTIVTAKDTSTSLVDASFTNRHGAVRLNDMGTLLQDPSLGCVQRTMMFSQINPFIWDQSSSQVNSPVVDFVLSECDNDNVLASTRKKREINNVPDDSSSFSVEMPVVPTKEAVLVNDTTRDVHGMIYHYINLTSPRQAVVISVYPRENESLVVYVNLDSKPSPTEYFMALQVPQNDTANYEDQHSLVLSVEDVANASYVEIGIKKNGCLEGRVCLESSDPGDPGLLYWYRISFLQCQYWDELLEIWSSKGCEVQKGSTPTRVKFKSNLFGSLGAGVFVGPNTIDFGTVFDDLDKKIAENAAVVGTVISVILVYIPFVVLCSYLDKKDKRKWLILPLVDNLPEDQYNYEVHVYTGLNSNSGTDSTVHLVLAGTESDTGIRVLVDGERKNFQRGEVSSFLLKTSASLGVPITMKIWHDNSGEGSRAGWYLSKVVVVDRQTSKWFLFACDKWLSAEEEDGRVERILHLAGMDELGENESFLLQNNIKKKLFDDHLWLSVGYRKTRSAFTRVQRLSCCLAILFLTMVSNAMWFGTGSTESNQTAFVIGPISLTVHQLYTSIVSSLIIVPPILIITYLFAKADRKQVQEERTYSNKASDIRGKKVGVKYHCCCSDRKLPHWVIYIAYTLIVLSVACGAFFTILYAFEWGKTKSTEWLVTFLLSFFESVVLIQPLKVIVIAALITFLFKKDIDTTDFEEAIGEKECRPEGLKPLNTDAVTTHLTLSEAEIRTARLRKQNDQKLHAMVREIVWQIVFLVLLLWVVMGNQDGNVYLQNQDLRNTFAGDAADIITKEDLWSWVRETLIPGLYYTTNYNGQQLKEYNHHFIANTYGMRLGPPRLRQLRVKTETCPVPYAMQDTVSRCTDQFSETSEAKDTLHRSVNTTMIASSDSGRIDDAFIYKSAQELKGIHFWGKFSWYPAGGYLANLGEDPTEAFDMVDVLEEANWIDAYTRVVVVEFNVWNANTNLFNMFVLSLELLPSGGVFHWLTIDSINLYRYSGAGGLVNLLAELCLTVFILVITVVYTVDLVKGKKSCGSFWVIITLICLALFYTALGVYVWRSVLTANTVEEMMNNKGKSINFQLLSLSNTIFINLLSIMTFLMILRLLSILRYNRTISVMALTIRTSSHELLAMTVTFGIFFVAFCVLCYDTFGSSMEEYSSIQATMSSLSEAFLGKFDFDNVTSAKGQFGGFVLIAYLMVMMLIIMNFFISLLNEFLAAVQEDPESLPKDHEVVEYCLEVLGKVFSIGKKPQGDDQKKLLEEESDAQSSDPDMGQKIGTSTHRENIISDLELTQRIATVGQVVEDMNEAPLSAAVGSFLEDFISWQMSDTEKTHTPDQGNDLKGGHVIKAADTTTKTEFTETQEEMHILNDIMLISMAKYNPPKCGL